MKVAIPNELRETLREVSFLIDQARHDPSIDLAYDNAIQIGRVAGGRYGPSPRPYVLRYVPTDDPGEGTWELSLAELEISDIAEGFLTEVALYTCDAPGCRRKFRDPEAHCPACDYVADPDYAHLSLADARPRLEAIGVCLAPDAHRDEVVAILGPPDETGGGEKHPGLGFLRPWIKYNRNDAQLRFEFGRGNKVTAVPFLPRDWKPGQ